MHGGEQALALISGASIAIGYDRREWLGMIEFRSQREVCNLTISPAAALS